MIYSILHTVAGKEQKFVVGSIGGTPVRALIVDASLSPANHVIYSDYDSLFTGVSFREIDNTPDEIDIDCFTSGALTDGIDQLDYAVMVPADRSKVDAFVAMVLSLNEL